MVFCAGFRHKNDELASELCEIISTLRDDFGDSQLSLIDSISCIENIATELTHIGNIESKTKTKNDLQAKVKSEAAFRTYVSSLKTYSYQASTDADMWTTDGRWTMSLI